MNLLLSSYIRKFKQEDLFNWDRHSFMLVALAAIPILIVAFYNTKLALAMVIGLIPATFAGVGPTRKSRVMILVLGMLIPLSLIAGSLLSQYTNVWITAITLALLTCVAAFMMTRGKPIWLTMIVPITALGLSFSSVQTTIEFFVIMLAESVIAFLIALCFPQRKVPPAPPKPRLTNKQAAIFGVLYALTLVTATLISWGWDHMGWVVGSAALVMRPSHAMESFRSIWRAVSILLGLVVVSAFVLLQPPPLLAVFFAAVVISLCAGLNKSRAYIMPFFMTICVFMMIEYPITGVEEVLLRFAQRAFEVGLGIIIALVFGLLIPAIIQRVKKYKQAKGTSLSEAKPESTKPPSSPQKGEEISHSSLKKAQKGSAKLSIPSEKANKEP